ncbi:MAG TPA: hypothetical protein VIM79_01485 [Niastella sp.]
MAVKFLGGEKTFLATHLKIPGVEKFLNASAKKFSYAVVNFSRRLKISSVENFLIASAKKFSVSVSFYFIAIISQQHRKINSLVPKCN